VCIAEKIVGFMQQNFVNMLPVFGTVFLIFEIEKGIDVQEAD
jgi:hypothetical protein